jgi:uncharacterized protein (TIGR03067 family)
MYSHLLTTILVLAAPAPAADGKKDAEKIQGTWTILSMERGGEKGPEDEIKNTKVVIADGLITIEEFKKPRKEEKATFKLDPAKNPKTIDITPERGKEGVALGIYELKGDTLKLCFTKPGGTRPREFASKAGTEQMLIVLQRDKKDK